MTHLNPVEIFLVIPILGLALVGFFNGLYICLHGIVVLDERFSTLKNFRDESDSPFDRFARMHRYVFSYVIGKKKPPLNTWARAWLHTTCITLIAYWCVVSIAILSYYFSFDPIRILSLGLSSLNSNMFIPLT